MLFFLLKASLFMSRTRVLTLYMGMFIQSHRTLSTQRNGPCL